MVSRWRYAEGKHPAYCTCVKCQTRAHQRPQPARKPRPERPTVQRPSRQYETPRRKHSRAWGFLAIALLSTIAAYLVLTVTAPSAIDSLMQEWARLFN